MSEMELSVLSRRAHEAQKLKAARGELFKTVAVGYRKVANEDRIEKEPDRRVQQQIDRARAELYEHKRDQGGRPSLDAIA